MTVGGIVTHTAAGDDIRLPAAYAEALERGMGNPEGLAGVCQHVAMLGKVEDRIVDCFREGEGVSYDTFADSGHPCSAVRTGRL